MAVWRENCGLPETGLPLLRDLIHERTGLYYDNGRCEMLSDRLGPLVVDRGFRSFLDLYYLLKYDEQSAALEWRRVIDALSVQETYFWREIDQIQALATHVIPRLAARWDGSPIRIWSAPCATGEEPLTIAMVLDEAGWFDRLPIEIHGSDGSASAIDRARKAQYRERAFRAIPAPMVDKYFTRNGAALTPTPALASRVTSWSVVNLMARDEVEPHAAVPLIFCRNAFIYFSPSSVKQVVNCFADLMPREGHLFVGASESLLSITDRFSLEEVGRAFAYVRR